MMKRIRRLAGIGAITCALVAAGSHAFAQDSRSSFTVMHQYVAADLPEDVGIPTNLQADALYRPLLQSMLEGSPTFRRQCLRLAGEPGLIVHLQTSGSVWTRGARALTHIVRRPEGGLVANVYLTKFDDDVELIAHEFEHVIEQLDQVDLESRAGLPDTGVHHTLSEGATFETARAQQVGLKVAREVRATARKAD